MKVKSIFFIFFSIIQFDILLAQDYSNTPSDPPAPVELPYDRFIQPAGKQILFGDYELENHALDCTISPDGYWLAVQERSSIVIISIIEPKIVYTYTLRDFRAIPGLMNNFSGITWYDSENKLYLLWSASSSSSDQSCVIQAAWDGTKLEIVDYFSFNPKPPARKAIPNEILMNRESGKDFLYTVLNGNDLVIKQDMETKDTIWVMPAGIAPYGIVRSGNKVYITNWGGGVPNETDKNVAGSPWSLAKVDSLTGATREGTVTVLDLNTGRKIKDIIVGLHPNEIIADKKGAFIYVTNSNSDNVSVISTATDEVVETISVRLGEDYNKYLGDSPNGIGISRNGKVLYVANGLDNAIAVISLGRNSSLKGKNHLSRVTGFIPTGAYPSSVVRTYDHHLFVTNLEGEGAGISAKLNDSDVDFYNVHHMLTSVSKIPLPNKKGLKKYTNMVIALNQLNRLTETELPARQGLEARPVPERIGEPSVFRHVLYIIKENRTYDQVLGDMKEGDGDSSLCIYGEKITPNTHKLAREFTLLDGFYVSGKSSAEGHQWTDASIVSDYVEKNMRSWLRSYPHVQNDALVYSASGFLWDNALRHGKSVMIFGEACIPVMDRNLTWKELYENYRNGKSFEFKNVTNLEPVKEILSQEYPCYGNNAITDILRADAFIRDLQKYDSMDGDQLPELMVMALPNNHTAGTRPGFPTPRAMVADNDLALGRIIDAITKSRFWPETVIFVIEDDSQGGWDHVSAYRSIGIVISPYSRIKSTIHTRYNQPSVIRTIEQILGIPPMNIQDAIAPAMFDCFNETENFNSYNALPNLIPLDEMNPPLTGLHGKALKFAKESMEPQFDRIDSGYDDQLNRILWFAAKGNAPYPGKFAGEE
jgi:YVTN family beta-propeller protein